jgi:N-acetylmuramoyl-L-alanine amidase
MANIKVSIINESTVVSDNEVVDAIADLQTQVSRDFAPAWGIDADLTFVPSGSQPARGSWWLSILDNSDQAGALGYHDTTNEGLPLGKVFAATDKQLGTSWTVTASHELLEMLGDPDINLTAFVQSSDTTGSLYAYEVADACEADNYGYTIGNTLVSDFVFPAWFESFAPAGTQLDQQGQIKKPFELLPGGYISVLDITSSNGWQQIMGQKAQSRYSSRAHVGSRRERRRTTRKEWLRSQRSFARTTYRPKAADVLAPAAQPIFQVQGKMSTFGGPDDDGVGPNEGLALFDKADLSNPKYAHLFLPAPPPGTSGLARRLDPAQNYLACRWDYRTTPRAFLRNTQAVVVNARTGAQAFGTPVDEGPAESTGRVADLSPGLAAALGLDTDNEVLVTIPADQATLMVSTGHDGHGSANPISKPPIKEFIPSPNHSSRNGAKIEMVVLHCTETDLRSTINEFKNPNGRQVSAHYVIDVNGDIYQMVQDSERANHARGANQNSIGIEHVRGADQPIADAQATASGALIRWLLAQYDIPSSRIYGHDFAPGYDRSRGGTSCPDRLFGNTHDQRSVVDWVARNV